MLYYIILKFTVTIIACISKYLYTNISVNATVAAQVGAAVMKVKCLLCRAYNLQLDCYAILTILLFHE